MGFTAFVKASVDLLKWRASKDNCEKPDSYSSLPIPTGFQHQWKSLVNIVTQDVERLPTISRRHNKSDRGFLYWKTGSNGPIYVYSFGFHCNPSNISFAEWRNCLAHDNVTTIDDYDYHMLETACPHYQMIQGMNVFCLFIGIIRRYIEKHITRNPRCVIKSDF